MVVPPVVVPPVVVPPVVVPPVVVPPVVVPPMVVPPVVVPPPKLPPLGQPGPSPHEDEEVSVVSPAQPASIPATRSAATIALPSVFMTPPTNALFHTKCRRGYKELGPL